MSEKQRRPVTTIEKTGKRWKGLSLIGAVVSLLGVYLVSAGARGGIEGGALFGVVVTCVGILLVIAARWGAWWHHG